MGHFSGFTINNFTCKLPGVSNSLNKGHHFAVLATRIVFHRVPYRPTQLLSFIFMDQRHTPFINQKSLICVSLYASCF